MQKNKPTKEELKAIQEAAINADPNEIEEETEESSIPDLDETESPVSEETTDEQEETEVEEVEQAEPSPDYKKKFSESSREAQKKTAANRIINKALAEAETAPEPTEEELQKEFTDWDLMSDTEKTFAKETVISRNWRKTIADAKNQAEKIEKWNDSVDEFVSDPKVLNDNPDLEGKADAFSEFAKQETNNNVPFNVLVGAFLHEQSTKKVNNKGAMFETGSGGPNEKPQPVKDTVTIEEARKIRETDYAKYKELLRDKKIEINV